MSTQNSLTIPINMLIASSIAELVEHPKSKFYSLRHLFIKPQNCIVQKFEEVIEDFSLDIDDEVDRATHKTIDLIVDINYLWEELPITFEELLDISEVDAGFELLGCMGVGVRFWNNYNLEDFGLFGIPPLPHTESFYEEASSILEKLRLAKRKRAMTQFSDSRKAA